MKDDCNCGMVGGSNPGTNGASGRKEKRRLADEIIDKGGTKWLKTNLEAWIKRMQEEEYGEEEKRR